MTEPTGYSINPNLTHEAVSNGKGYRIMCDSSITRWPLAVDDAIPKKVYDAAWKSYKKACENNEANLSLKLRNEIVTLIKLRDLIWSAEGRYMISIRIKQIKSLIPKAFNVSFDGAKDRIGLYGKTKARTYEDRTPIILLSSDSPSCHKEIGITNYFGICKSRITKWAKKMRIRPSEKQRRINELGREYKWIYENLDLIVTKHMGNNNKMCVKLKKIINPSPKSECSFRGTAQFIAFLNAVLPSKIMKLAESKDLDFENLTAKDYEILWNEALIDLVSSSAFKEDLDMLWLKLPKSVKKCKQGSVSGHLPRLFS